MRVSPIKPFLTETIAYTLFDDRNLLPAMLSLRSLFATDLKF